jgi:hypothetical protein
MGKALTWALAAIALVSLVASFALDISQGASVGRSLALTAMYFLMLTIFVRTDATRLPPKLYIPFISGFDASAFAKAIGCFLVGCVWAYTSARVANTIPAANGSWWGVAGVAGLPILLMIVGVAFLYRSLVPRND